MENQIEKKPNEEIILVGGGGHCKSVIDVLEAAGRPIGGIVHDVGYAEVPVLGYPALGTVADLPKLRGQYEFALVAAGQIKDPLPRRRLHDLLQSLGFKLPYIISPHAKVSRHAVLGPGSIVMHHSMVNAAAVVGENAIINSHALVEHDCQIGNDCHVAIGAVLGGNVIVGNGSFIGAGAIVRNNTRIGSDCIIGMGARVLKDIPDGSVYLG